MIDLSYAWKTPASHGIWHRVLCTAQELRRTVAGEVLDMVHSIQNDEVMCGAVRSSINASDRHEVTDKEAYAYLLSTYEAAVATGTRQWDWTITIHMWARKKTIYIALEQTTLFSLDELFVLAMGDKLQGYGLPGTKMSETMARQKVWDQLGYDFSSHYEIPVCDLYIFESFGTHYDDIQIPK